MTDQAEAPGRAFEAWGRAQAESNHHHHLASRPKGTATFEPADCAHCTGWVRTFGHFRDSFLEGRKSASSPEKEAAIEGLVKAALEAVRVAQEEGSGSYESTLELADALRAARLAGLTKEPANDPH